MHHTHIPFTAWAAVAVAVAALVALPWLAKPVRRHLSRLAGCAIAGVLAATAVTAYADRHLSRHPAHGLSGTGSLVTGFAVTAIVVAVIAFAIATARARRRARARSSAAGAVPRVRVW